MRVDIITIFPAFFDVLDISLVGRARKDGIIDVAVTDLRSYANDKHRTVDDTPYGGGPGMLMRPEPWGAALDEILAAASGSDPLLLVPTPAGTPFTQQQATQLAMEKHVVFACGRYEGIDQRVLDVAAEKYRVREVCVGDYVLNGGESAALVVLEAVLRLVPGVVGNSDSLTEESHAAGLLEAPSFTKPASWRGHDVPPVLLSGDHGAIARWRREQSLVRTAQRRPDLVSRIDPASLNAADLAVLEELGWTVSGGAFRPSRDSVAD